MPRRPVWVSVTCWPTSACMTVRVTRLPTRLRSGTSRAESAGAQDHDAIRLGGEPSGDLLDIVGMVLAVGIRGDDSREAGIGAQGIVDAGLQRGALAQIDRVTHQPDGGKLFGAAERFRW